MSILSVALERLMEEHHLPGMSAAIVYRRAVAWSKGFGYADLEHDVWAEPSTRYPLAPVSKSLAAVLVMQLVEQGKLSLDAPMKAVEEFGGRKVIWHTGNLPSSFPPA